MISFYSGDYIKYFYLPKLETHSSFGIIHCQYNLLKILTFNSGLLPDGNVWHYPHHGLSLAEYLSEETFYL